MDANQAPRPDSCNHTVHNHNVFKVGVRMMIASASIEPFRYCQVKHYVTAWVIGTGLPVGLKPGEYRITESSNINGALFLQLDGVFRCPAEACEQICWQQLPTSD